MSGENFTDGTGPKPEAWWYFEETAGASRLDGSGNGNTLADTNTVGQSSDHKQGLYSAQFVAASSQRLSRASADLSANYPLKLSPTTAFTIGGWFYCTNLPGTEMQLYAHAGSSPGLYISVRANNYIRVRVREGAVWPYVESNSAISATTWYHVVGRWDGTHLHIFMNGVKQTAEVDVADVNEVDAVLYLGTLGTTLYFNGLMDEWFAFSSALTDAQIADIYNYSLEGWTDLIIQDAAHAQTVENIVLVPRVSLVIQNASHAQTADSPLLSHFIGSAGAIATAETFGPFPRTWGPIKFFGVASTPADNGTNTTNPTVVTPPASMIANDLVVMVGQSRATSGTLSISQAGGQTWTSRTQQNATTCRTRVFWCRFNGTWSANPSVTMGATTCNTVVMLVFRPSYQYMISADKALQQTTFSAPSSPYTVTRAGQTLVENAVAIAGWHCIAANTWGTLAGAGWSKTGLGAQYRNTSGSDQSATFAYYIGGPGATGSVSQNESGSTAGATKILSFSELGPPAIPDAGDISSGETFGTAVLSQGITAEGIASAEAFGELNTGPQIIDAGAIAGGEIIPGPVVAVGTMLVIANAAHAQSVGNVVLVQHSVLDITHGIFLLEAADHILVEDGSYLLIEGAGTLHVHTADNLVLVPHEAGVVLVIQNSSHAQTVGNADLIQHHVLAIANATHAQTAGGLVLVQSHHLAVANAQHAHVSENVIIIQHQLLVLADAAHGHAVGNVTLLQHHILAVANSSHAHTADNLVLTGAGILVVQNAAHAQAADAAILAQHHILVVQNAQHGQSADNAILIQHHVLAIANSSSAQTASELALIQHHLLVVADALHGQTADNVILTGAGILVIQGAIHAHGADNVTLVQHHILTISNANHAKSANNLDLIQHHILALIDSADHTHAVENVVLIAWAVLTIQNANHIQAADNLILTGAGLLAIQNASHAHAADELALNLFQTASRWRRRLPFHIYKPSDWQNVFDEEEFLILK